MWSQSSRGAPVPGGCANRPSTVALRTQSYPARHELNGVPIGVAGDLVGYTGLGRDFVERERERRREISFWTEWHASPGHLRADHWYYLSSKGYLFANASHVVNSGFVDRFVRIFRQGGRVLDYGGAAGNLATDAHSLRLRSFVRGFGSIAAGLRPVPYCRSRLEESDQLARLVESSRAAWVRRVLGAGLSQAG